ncbi:MAG: hypothetical protein NXI32_02205 [bacterium]|nr:hypothetical protein [bacterium]
MTSHSGANQPSSPNLPAASWTWLQSRVHDGRRSSHFRQWMERQRDVLERDFAHLATPRSRSRALRADLELDSSRTPPPSDT